MLQGLILSLKLIISINFTSEEFKNSKICKKRFDDSKDNLKAILNRLNKNYKGDSLIYLTCDIIYDEKY